MACVVSFRNDKGETWDFGDNSTWQSPGDAIYDLIKQGVDIPPHAAGEIVVDHLLYGVARHELADGTTILFGKR